MAGSQFIPGGSSYGVVDALNSGINTGASLMERKQAMRLREEQAARMARQERRQQEQDEIMRPVVIAQSQEQLAKAQAGLLNLEKNHRLAAQFATESTQAEDEWLEVMNLASPDSQAKAAVEWTGRWMKFAPLAEFGDLWNQRKEVAGKFLQHAFDMRKIEDAFVTDEIKLKSQKELIAARGAEDRATAEATGRGLPIEGKLMRLRDEALEAGDVESAKEYDELIKKRKHISLPYSDADRIMQLDATAKQAEADGDIELATALRSRMQLLTSRRSGSNSLEEKLKALDGILGGGPAAAASASPFAAQAAPAPTTGASQSAIPPTINF